MNKTFDKILERLEADEKHTFDGCINKRYVKQIVQEVAEEYKSTEYINCSTNDSTCGWIPCNSEFPKPKGSTTMKVWMSFYNKTQNGDFSYVKSGRWHYGHFEYENGKRVPDDILVAWMPYYAPEPYKKDYSR